MEEDLFVHDVVGVLNYSKAYPEEYRKVCTSFQEYAREHYDWSKHIEKWVNFLL
jgi:hypothetical protein